MKNKIAAFIQALNGWKTVIGILLIKGTPAAYAVISSLIVSGWGGTMPAIGPKLVFTGIWLGQQIATIGVLHKLIKYDPSKPFLQQFTPIK